MAKVIAFPIMLLAAFGVLASVVTSVLVTAYPAIQKPMLMLLFPGVFLVSLPTILLTNYLTRDFKRQDFWKAALRGCPRWMRAGLWTVTGCTFGMFFIPFLWGSSPEKFPPGFAIFPVSFCAVSFCAMYSILHLEQTDALRRCLNGHQISPLAKYCEECGAPSRP